MEYPFKLIDKLENHPDIHVPETIQKRAQEYATAYRKKAPDDSCYILINGGFNYPPEKGLSPGDIHQVEADWQDYLQFERDNKID